MSFAPSLGFRGNAREAMTFYADVFGASDLEIRPFSSFPPDQRPPGTDDMVMHAHFSEGPGAPLLASDMPDGMDGDISSSISVFHAAPSIARAAAIYEGLVQGGTVIMPMAASFWSKSFGMLTDKFGVRWMINVAPGG